MEKFRSRKMCLLLYPLEDESHKKAIEYIKLNYDYALIVHDKDEDENGVLKKSHTHVVVSFPSQRWNTAIAEDLGITPNYIERCRSFSNALEYLIHYCDDTKYQYDIEEVQGNLKSELKKILNNDGKDENIKAFELIEYIENYDGPLYLGDFYKYACEKGVYDVARRSAVIMNKIIEIHNHQWSQAEYYRDKGSFFK